MIAEANSPTLQALIWAYEERLEIADSRDRRSCSHVVKLKRTVNSLQVIVTPAAVLTSITTPTS